MRKSLTASRVLPSQFAMVGLYQARTQDSFRKVYYGPMTE